MVLGPVAALLGGTKPAIRDTCARHGYAGPEICTPGELMGGLEDGG